MQKNRGRSGHPVDRLIRELVRTGRGAAPDDVTRIIDRIATAEFDRRIVRIPIVERGIEYGNRRLLPWDDALFAHLVRRVVRDAQWVSGTTIDQYVSDLRAAARGGDVRLAVYFRRGGAIALVVAPTAFVLPDARRGARSFGLLAVVYSADRGIIVTGYQVPSQDYLSILKDARWLL